MTTARPLAERSCMKPEIIQPMPTREPGGARGKESRVTCPVCGGSDKLKFTHGMLVCTRCYWATEMKQAS